MRRIPTLVLLIAAVVAVVSSQAGEAAGPLDPLRVGVFLGHGAAGTSGENAVEALRIDPAVEVRRITSAEILAGGLADLKP